MKLTNKVNDHERIQHQNKKGNVSFKSGAAVTAAVNYINMNPAWGTTFVDTGSMVAPRTAIDFNRNPIAGFETLCREIAGVFNHIAIGLYGAMAAAGLHMIGKFHNKYNVNFNHIYADNKSITHLSHAWNDSIKELKLDPTNIKNKQQIQKKYYDKVLTGINVKDSKNDIINDLLKHDSDKLAKGDLEWVISKVTKEIDSKSHVKLSGIIKDESLESDLKSLIQNTYTLGKTFGKEKVLPTFKDGVDNNKFLKFLKSNVIKKTAIGLGIGSIFGLSVQAINRRITKKRTGIEGFVGYNNIDPNNITAKNKPKKDNSLGFKLLKVGAAGIMAAITLKSIGKLKEIPKKIQFKSLLPTNDQIKVIYGSTIIGRLLASEDQNELRETATRDYLGFLNLLLIGGLVTKGIARALDKSLINPKTKDLISHEEIIDKVIGSDAIKIDEKTNTRIGRKKMKEIYKDLAQKLGKESKEFKNIKLKFKNLNKAHIGGLLYSGLVLGVFIPWFNGYLTEKLRSKDNKPEIQPTQNNKINSTINFKSNTTQDNARRIYSAFVQK